MARCRAHWADDAWLPRDYPDPFGRSASVMPWDRLLKTWVLDDSRAYDVGLSDDAGGGNPLGFAIKARLASRSIPPRRRSIRLRLALRTYAPWGVRVVSLTKSRKIPTRKTLPLFLVEQVAYAPTQHQVTRLDDYVKWTLYGVKPDTAKPPLKSLQIRPEDCVPNVSGSMCGQEDGIRRTMHVQRGVHLRLNGGQVDFVWFAARTMHHHVRYTTMGVHRT